MSPFVLEEDCLCCKLSLSMFVMYVRDSFRTNISMCKLRWPDSGPEFEIALPHRPFLPHFPWFERNVTFTLSVCICVCICIFAYHETIYYSHSRRTYREIDRPFGPLQSNTVNDVTKTRLICCSPNMYIYIYMCDLNMQIMFIRMIVSSLYIYMVLMGFAESTNGLAY